MHELTFFGLKGEIHKGSLYVAYGFDGSGRLNSIECYNPHFRTWKEVANFKCELSSPACAVLNGKMYITGGKNSKVRALIGVASSRCASPQTALCVASDCVFAAYLFAWCVTLHCNIG